PDRVPGHLPVPGGGRDAARREPALAPRRDEEQLEALPRPHAVGLAAAPRLGSHLRGRGRMRPRAERALAVALAFAALVTTAVSAAPPPSRTAPPPEVSTAVRAFDRGDYAGALALARQRLRSLPRDTAALVLAGRAQAALGRFEDAYQGFRKALSVQPGNTDALYYLSILGGVLAQGEYERLLAQAPESPRAHQLRGDLHAAQQRPAEAEAEYKAALEGAPGSLEVLIALGDLTRRQSRFEEALGYYARAAEVAPHDYDVLYGTG